MKNDRGKSPNVWTAVVAACTMSVAAAALAHDDSFWISARTRGLGDDADVLFASNIITRAAKAGMRYVLWPKGLDTYWRWSEDRKARFREVKRIVDENGMVIVPSVWSTGYATMTNVDPGLIESKPVNGLPYVARGGNLVPDVRAGQLAPVGGFDECATLADLAAAGWATNDMRAPASFDTGVARSGKASLRVDQREGMRNEARISRRIALRPGSMYRASVWYRSEDLPAASGHLRLQVRVYAPPGVDGGDKTLVKTLYHYDSSKDASWRKLTIDFHAGASEKASIACGSWNAKAGTFWMDEVSVEETGIREIAQREDSPRTFRNAATGRAYEFGRDWKNPGFSQPVSGEGDVIEFPLPEGSAIKEGESVLLDTYVPSRAGPKMQVSTCMSDPRLYELFRKSAETLEELLHPDKWYLSLDEIRNGGTCPLCSARKTDMAHILAGCVLRQHEIIRSVHPGADIYMTSDMVDPFHNAKEGPYYGCSGTFHGVWDLIPHDIIISLWWDRVIDKSVPFFTERGFRVTGSISVSTSNLDHLSKWKEVFDAHPGAMGFRYTTWTMNYDMLGEFVEKLRRK